MKTSNIPLWLKIIFICSIYLNTTELGYSQEKDIISQVDILIDQAWELTISNNDSARFIIQEALSISQKNGYHLGEVLARESMGVFHEIVTADIGLASKEYFEAVELCEQFNLNYISSIYHSLGILFHTTDNYEEAKNYFNLSLEKSREQGDSLLIKKCLVNLGAVYSSLENFEQAEAFMKQSLEIPIDKATDYDTYVNLGYLYVKQKKFAQAIPLLLRSTEENPENPDSDINLYFLLHAKTMAKDSSNMEKALTRAKKAANSGKYGLRDQSLLYRNIADYLNFIGNYKEALHYRNQYIVVFEEIKEKQRDQIVLDMAEKYETDKKDAQLKVLQLETEKQEQQMRLYAFAAFAGLMIAGLIGFFLFQNRKKNKLLLEQKKQLEENVEEINLLLREIHHRVKNNLQVITSLLNIQQRSISDENAVKAIQESKNRIESMGLIHQNFYQNKKLGAINTREYIQNLANKLLESYGPIKHQIELETKVQDIHLDMDTLVPLGLIINEMVSNTLKHAFDENESGKLSISLLKNKDKFKLEISDNGSGLNNISALEKSDSFGLNMIKAFVKKLNGSLNLLNTEGTTFQIEFSV